MSFETEGAIVLVLQAVPCLFQTSRHRLPQRYCREAIVSCGGLVMNGRLGILFASLAFAMCFFPCQGFAVQPGEWQVVRVAPDDTLNIRKWPGTTASDIVHRLAPGTRGIRIVECVFDGIPDSVWSRLDAFTKGRTSAKTWCFIMLSVSGNIVFGWVNASYLERVNNPEPQAPSGRTRNF